MPIVVVGTKADQIPSNDVQLVQQMLKDEAKACGIQSEVAITSAKTGEGVKKVFKEVGDLAVQHRAAVTAAKEKEDADRGRESERRDHIGKLGRIVEDVKKKFAHLHLPHLHLPHHGHPASSASETTKREDSPRPKGPRQK